MGDMLGSLVTSILGNCYFQFGVLESAFVDEPGLLKPQTPRCEDVLYM